MLGWWYWKQLWGLQKYWRNHHGENIKIKMWDKGKLHRIEKLQLENQTCGNFGSRTIRKWERRERQTEQ